jgi:hypothetical protein
VPQDLKVIKDYLDPKVAKAFRAHQAVKVEPGLREFKVHKVLMEAKDLRELKVD